MSDTPREGFVWVLDAASSDVFRLAAPGYWDSLDSEEIEGWIQTALPDDVRLKDCNWLFTYNPLHYVLDSIESRVNESLNNDQFIGSKGTVAG